MSEVVNQDAADAAERPAMETVPDPMVFATPGGTLQAQTNAQNDGVQGSTNVLGNVQGNIQGVQSSQGFQGVQTTP